MNAQSKKILFNQSTLLNLKAELLKKQEEVKGKKHLPEHNIQNYKCPLPKPTKDGEDSSQKGKKSFKDSLQSVDTEELEAYKKTKAALEKKAELYDHLANPVGDSQMANKFLVDFNSKKTDLLVNDFSTTNTIEPELNDEAIVNDDDSEWTEFRDCLGRTRKCLKTDLEFYKENDKDLMKRMTKSYDDDTEKPKQAEQSRAEKPLLVQKTSDYLQSLREKWEEKERELSAKAQDIHYQDLLFDEARIHGVGYYAFSTDEATRKQQMEDLLSSHEETLRAQVKADQKRRQREDLVAARLKAAKARERLRKGLQPEEQEDHQKDFDSILLDFLNKQKEEAEAKAKEDEIKIKEQIEKERQKLREAYIREWDRGKEGVKDKKTKPFKEMTQEEYMDRERDKRISEFAPPQTSSSSRSNSSFKRTFDDIGKQSEKPTSSKSWSDVRPKLPTPPPPDISNCDDDEQQKGLYFTTKKSKADLNYKNFVKAQQPVPILNEINDDEDAVVLSKPREGQVNTNHAAIAPPPTYDYYGPVPKRSREQRPFHSDLREAYDQGTKSLERKAKDVLPLHYDFSQE